MDGVRSNTTSDPKSDQYFEEFKGNKYDVRVGLRTRKVVIRPSGKSLSRVPWRAPADYLHSLRQDTDLSPANVCDEERRVVSALIEAAKHMGSKQTGGAVLDAIELLYDDTSGRGALQAEALAASTPAASRVLQQKLLYNRNKNPRKRTKTASKSATAAASADAAAADERAGKKTKPNQTTG